jgi:enamine deaminase RidA (YjgF/YER057c/UK114 family)
VAPTVIFAAPQWSKVVVEQEENTVEKEAVTTENVLEVLVAMAAPDLEGSQVVAAAALGGTVELVRVDPQQDVRQHRRHILRVFMLYLEIMVEEVEEVALTGIFGAALLDLTLPMVQPAAELEFLFLGQMVLEDQIIQGTVVDRAARAALARVVAALVTAGEATVDMVVTVHPQTVLADQGRLHCIITVVFNVVLVAM